MENDFDYLRVSDSDKNILKHLSEMGERLKQLKEKQLAAEAAAENAKKEYEHYANVILPNEMHSCGVESIALASGGKMSIKRNFYCQPNKNAADRAVMVAWLREHGGGHLVEHDAKVSPEDMERLDNAGIPYVENTSVNTQRLKSFLKDGIGATTGIQQFDISEIPVCMHFQEVTTVDIQL